MSITKKLAFLINVLGQELARKCLHTKNLLPFNDYYSCGMLTRIDYPILYTSKGLLLLGSTQNAIRQTFSTTACLLDINGYYKLLNVQQTAPTKEIKSSYFQIAKQCHPDINQNDPKAADMFRKVSEAYEVLSDDHRRARYDSLTDDLSNNQKKRKEYTYSHATTDDVRYWENVDPDDDFRKQFGRWTKWSRNYKWSDHRKSRNQSQANNDYYKSMFVAEKTVSISFTEAAKGTKRELRIPHPLNGFRNSKYKKLRTIVDIKPGIEDKKTLHLVIDHLVELYVTVRIKPSKHFRRIGFDVYSNAKVSYSTSVSGGKIRIEGLYGDIYLEIPAGTVSCTTFILSEQGFKMPKSDKSYGNHFVYVRVAKCNEKKRHLGRKQRKSDWDMRW